MINSKRLLPYIIAPILIIIGANFMPSSAAWAANNSPTVGSVTPSSGLSSPDTAVTFIAIYSDSNGWVDIKTASILINTVINSKNCFYAYYNQNTNKLYLRNDLNTAWLGGFAPGSANIIENSYVKLDCSKSKATGLGNNLVVKWNVTFKNTFLGPKNIYLNVTDEANSASTWIKKGAWSICYPDSTPPAGTIKINNGAAYTDKVYVTLNLSVLDNTGGSGVDKMRFSNDNITWTTPQLYAATRTWMLTSGEGAKAVYARFSDKAGNWSAPVSGAITLYKGALVTAVGGGTVVSPDGKAKVIIPSKALLANTRIMITCPDMQSYQPATPNNYSLYVVADCKPNNIIFYKPVKLIFTLNTPQIPGTPVYLGLYNEIDGTIEVEEFSSFVASDGITAEFSINHFSTYAAMQGSLTQGAPIGASTKTPLPDLFTGSFSHSIPIGVAPGRKGVQPGLTLQYRSSNPNSWVGTGWALNTGYITRQARRGLPAYDDAKDTFTFISDSFATELVHLVDNLYQAKIEGGFMKFYKQNDDSWKVVSKDGSYMLLGTDSEAKELGANAHTYNWYLTKAVDNNSNYITYSYTKDQGKCYLSRIEYTGNEKMCVSAKYSVDFNLEDRTDVQSSYASGAEIKTAKRLKSIEANFDYGLIWKYELEYAYSPDTGRSLLKTFTQYTSDGKPFPVQTFNYQASND